MLRNSIKFGVGVISKRVRLGRPGTSLKIGLLGMANIGKSSTFNILSDLNVPAENIPFCTIDPNTAFVQVHDPRFEQLVKMYGPEKVAGPILRIVDIAGLVKGASEGFGLGNQFLSHIMQVDALYHVVRAFPGEQIAHTEGGMDAVRDIKIIRHELIQKDLEMVERKTKEYSRKASKGTDRNLKQQYQVLLKVQKSLKQDKVEIRNLKWQPVQVQILNKYLFLTSKPIIYLINLSKEDYLNGNIENKKEIQDLVTDNGKFITNVIPFSVQHEKTVINMPKERSQKNKILRSAYEELEIHHFYTVGTDQVRAWAIRKGETAVQAAGKIHTDFIRGFINAEVIHADTLISNPTYKLKLAKHIKKEGKTYIVKDGDIINFNSKIK